MTEAEKAVNAVFEREAQRQTLAGLSEAITDLRSMQIHVAYPHQNIIYQPVVSREFWKAVRFVLIAGIGLTLLFVFRAQIVEFLWGSMQ